jgi:enoyl-[acyl-carrier protein] reductase/trans-2-enoyl-CoA reductase (NAD+)
MVIKPRIRGFICTTAHPPGCAASVRSQIDYVRWRGEIDGPRNALIVGCSAGYGLASRIVAAFGAGTSTIGVSYEKAPSGNRTASAGWYNNRAFDAEARAAGLLSESIDADAFADATKEKVVERLRQSTGPIDLLVHSVAAPVRTDPATGQTYRSAIKPIGAPVRMKSLNVERAEVHDVELVPASDDEIHGTVKVMGGEDWERWVAALAAARLLAPGFRTLAYTYIGSELTWPIYWQATLGRAKEDLDRAAGAMRAAGHDARVAVLKAVVTQASTAIPVVPLYSSILFRVMKDWGLHEDCIAHIDRLFRMQVYGRGPLRLDEAGRIRVDDIELRGDVQAEVKRRFAAVDTANVRELADIDGFRRDFLRVFGFEVPGIDYEADVGADEVG